MLKRCVRFLNQVINITYQRIIPLHLRWRIAQRRYVAWSRTPMHQNYLDYVKRLGIEFSKFVGEPTRLIDIGCGNGAFGGVSYAESGYYPLKIGGGYILGVDPLNPIYPIPWISEFKKGRIEDLKLSGFNEATFVTTFDHISNPDAALQSISHAGVSHIFLWETLYPVSRLGDMDHPHHYTFDELSEVLLRNGYAVKRRIIVDPNPNGDGCFIEAEKIECK